MTHREAASKANSGSPPTGEPEYLVVGILRRPHGVKGEMLMEVVTDWPERLRPGIKVFVGRRREARIIQANRMHGAGMLIHFRGMDSPESAGVYRNQAVYVLSADRPRLPEGQYYHHQLVGCTVEDEQQQRIGELTEILQTGANDVYVIDRQHGSELLLPAIPGVVLGVDLERRLIRVRIPLGMDSEARA